MKYTLISLSAITLLAACSQAENMADKAANKTQEVASDVAAKTTEMAKDGLQAAKDMTPGADLSALPSGIYKSEQGHTYVSFQYWHQDYSKPIIRWGETNATIELNADNPEESTLMVTIPSASIDTGVPDWDKHIKSADFFDVENFPTITFKSTDIDQAFLGGGSVTGDMTIKGVTKPVTFTGKVNKVGKHFRSGVDMFGISATGKLNRSDFGVDTYAPMAEEIDITIEAEFQKAE
ncbi:YceI family protein [Litorimonas sp. RW-G-Af-16]|uniref:YceI family protein n=1 Tax=Litorimonas sp. RW-G-Af-16 TaxID=3241168 RepID=UPI003AADEA91